MIYLLCQTYGPYTGQVHSIIKSLGVTKKDRQNPHSHNVVKKCCSYCSYFKINQTLYTFCSWKTTHNTSTLNKGETLSNFHLAKQISPLEPYFERPKTCYCQQQSSQYPIFPSQARDQSFTRVARNETKYQKILDAADFARHENCSFIRFNDAFRKTLLKPAQKKL